jgi:hypothetical protein
MDQQRLKERAIEAALRGCALEDPPNYSAIAKKHSTEQFQIDRSTLSRRHRGKTTSQAEYISNVSRALSDIQEDTLVLVINKYTARGIPPTSMMVKNFAEELCRHELDKNWVGRFVKRHTTLRSGYLRNIEHARTKAEFAPNFILFFIMVSFLSIFLVFFSGFITILNWLIIIT